MNIAIVLVDGEECHEIEYDSPLYEPSMKWARFHGLDPNRIPAGSVIVRDEAKQRILFEEYVFDGEDLQIEEDQAVVVCRIEQGEAAPLPFPCLGVRS